MADIIDMSHPGWEGVNAESPLPPDESQKFHWLCGAFLHQPTWAPGYTTDYGFYREGQNTLIREILLRGERATNG